MESKKRAVKNKKLMVLFIVFMLPLGVSILAYAQDPKGAKPQEQTFVLKEDYPIKLKAV
jgi:hypothetical protein